MIKRWIFRERLCESLIPLSGEAWKSQAGDCSLCLPGQDSPLYLSLECSPHLSVGFQGDHHCPALNPCLQPSASAGGEGENTLPARCVQEAFWQPYLFLLSFPKSGCPRPAPPQSLCDVGHQQHLESPLGTPLSVQTADLILFPSGTLPVFFSLNLLTFLLEWSVSFELFEKNKDVRALALAWHVGSQFHPLLPL